MHQTNQAHFILSSNALYWTLYGLFFYSRVDVTLREAPHTNYGKNCLILKGTWPILVATASMSCLLEHRISPRYPGFINYIWETNRKVMHASEEHWSSAAQMFLRGGLVRRWGAFNGEKQAATCPCTLAIDRTPRAGYLSIFILASLANTRADQSECCVPPTPIKTPELS